MNITTRPLRVLYWLPLGLAFAHYCYAIKTVRGRSMQVRGHTVPSDLLPFGQPTLNPDTSPSHDVVVFDRLSVRSGRPIAIGDVVSLRYVARAPVSVDANVLAETPSTVEK
jgi:inner membrane protease subunit 2